MRPRSELWLPNRLTAIRLVAASQVLLYHLTRLLWPSAPRWFERLLAVTPGVPVFFVLSGFLVAASLERSPDAKSYWSARLLRIYPALWLCFVVSVVARALLVGLPIGSMSLLERIGWLVGQVFLGRGTPPDLRLPPVGTLNPSLWTIAVELTLYATLPLLVLRGREQVRPRTLLVGCAAVVSATTDVLLASRRWRLTGIELQLVELTVRYVWLFLLGAVCWWALERVHRWLTVGHGLPLLAVTMGLSLTVLGPGYAGRPGTVAAVEHVVARALLGLSALGIGLSFGRSGHSGATRRWDISYGLYLFHGPVMVLAANSIPSVATSPVGMVAVVAISALLAAMSWIVVERPALEQRTRLVGLIDRVPRRSLRT